jgi:hypothetical protein
MGIAQKTGGVRLAGVGEVQRGTESERVADGFGCFWRTLPKSPATGSGSGYHSREQTNLQERGGPGFLTVRAGFRTCMNPAGHESKPLEVGEIEVKSSCGWPHSAGLAGVVLFWGSPY